MSDETTTDAAAEAAARIDVFGDPGGADRPPPDAADDAASEQHDDSEHDAAGKEAAKYRRRLRETEAERDALRGRVETMQRNEIQRMAADRLADPADLWRDGAKVSDLLNEGG